MRHRRSRSAAAAAAANSGALEEVVQGMIERLVNKAVYDQDAPWSDDTGKNEDAVFNLRQSLQEGAMGAAIGGILGGGQMLAQDIAARGQRIVDPTASPLDQAILDTLQGVQTPENVTQVREPTALDNAILAAMNQNKNTSADVAEVESTAVNDNPATHTPQEMQIIENYKNSVDDGLVEFYNKYKTQEQAQKGVKPYMLNPVSERAAADIAKRN